MSCSVEMGFNFKVSTKGSKRFQTAQSVQADPCRYSLLLVNLRYPNLEDRCFKLCYLSHFLCTKGNHSHITFLIGESFSMESEIVRVVSLSTTEMFEIKGPGYRNSCERTRLICNQFVARHYAPF